MTTKSGKTGVITNIHKKTGYLFIKNQETGKVYHVSWASVTHVNGEDAAEVAGKGQSATGDWQSPAGKAILEAHGKKAPAPSAEGPIVASYPAQAPAMDGAPGPRMVADQEGFARRDGLIQAPEARQHIPGGRGGDAPQPQ